MYNRYRACITKNDFIAFSDIKHIPNAVPPIDPDSTTLPSNTWAYNTTYGSAHVNDTQTDKKGGFNIPLGYLKKGDTIRVSTEFLYVSGSKPRISILNKDTSKVREYYSTMVNYFENIDIEIVAYDDGYHDVFVGTITSEIGEFYVRNIQIKMRASVNEVKPYTKNIKSFAIKTTGAGVFELQSPFVNDACTFSISGTNLRITFAEPFTGYASSTKRPIAIVGQRASTNTQNYDIRNAVEDYLATGTFVEVVFYQKGTATKVDANTIPLGVYFDILVIGVENLATYI